MSDKRIYITNKVWRHGTIWAFALLILFLASSCQRQSTAQPRRSMYYWQTTLAFDTLQRQFLSLHRITRLYVRYFDVVNDMQGHPVPNATLGVVDTVPKGIEVVPVVFVMPQCLRGDVGLLASRIVRRIGQMSRAHAIPQADEVQIDCDWTRSTRKAFRLFMKAVCDEAHRRGLRVSVTIRLHQLAQEPPPADRGVLMMYNTGDPRDLHCDKPILDVRAARPYLRHLSAYRMPLVAAYPVFGWRLLTRAQRFVGILHYEGEYPMLAGDSVVVRRPSSEDIEAARQALYRRRAGIHDEIVLFDLSLRNISRYSPAEFERMYR